MLCFGAPCHCFVHGTFYVFVTQGVCGRTCVCTIVAHINEHKIDSSDVKANVCTYIINIEPGIVFLE